MQTNYTWESQFRKLFDESCSRYHNGDTDPQKHYDETSRSFLNEIGYQPREFFDFVEDFCDGGDPSPETALLVAAVRRDYFHVIQHKTRSDRILTPGDLPDRTSELSGFTWLPRILAKARAKLRGELDPDIMYCCGGDRAFLSRHDIHPADFLRATWAAGDDDSKVLAYLRTTTSR